MYLKSISVSAAMLNASSSKVTIGSHILLSNYHLTSAHLHPSDVFLDSSTATVKILTALTVDY